MKRSTDRTLVTHVGSLVRPMSIRNILWARDHGEPYDEAAYEKTLREEVAGVVRKQADTANTARPAGSAMSPSGWAASCIANSAPATASRTRST